MARRGMSIFDSLWKAPPCDLFCQRLQVAGSKGTEEGRRPVRKIFHRFTTGCARFAGTPAMLLMCVALSAFGITSDLVGNDHLVNAANLSISVLTLLILPVLQASQNRDGAALQAKLDELIRVTANARDAMIGLENRSDDEIEAARGDGTRC